MRILATHAFTGESGNKGPAATHAVSRPAEARRPTWRVLLAGVLLALGSLAVAPNTASAATAPGYPSATVEYGASTRTLPYVRSNTYWGYALRNRGATTGNQTVSVTCWYDGDWATGNYRTNRWFKVYVWESYDGYAVPRWLFVHASYVFNQPTVRRCTPSSTGIW